MEPISIILFAIVFLFFRMVIRAAVVASNSANDPNAPNATDAPAQRVAKADALTVEKHPVSSAEKAFDRMEMQRHISARKAELQAKRENRKATQTIPASEAPTKSQQQAVSVQPALTVKPSPSDSNKWMEGFDIRRALVWSEILRPKFKEDET